MFVSLVGASVLSCGQFLLGVQDLCLLPARVPQNNESSPEEAPNLASHRSDKR
jgi:hypothetical protein